MTYELKKAEGPPPRPVSKAGRKPIYPYRTMAVGEFFFVPGHSHNNLTVWASRMGAKLNRKFVTSLQWMVLTKRGWVLVTAGVDYAVQGVHVQRVE